MKKQGPSDKPWYKRKYPLDHYHKKGLPKQLTAEVLEEEVPDWLPPEEVDYDLWEDAKTAVFQRDKKREYLINYDEPRLLGWKWSMKIEIMSVHRQGFSYEATGKDRHEMEKRFWPIIKNLNAHFFSPKLLEKHVVVPPDELKKENVASCSNFNKVY